MRLALSLTACLVTTLLVPPSAAAQSWPTQAWPTATPEAVGLDAAVLAAIDADIAAGKYGHVDGMLVIRHGKVAYEEYADRHLFAPLGITRYFWKRSPSGLTDTEGGLYLRTHDVAKIAYLFLRNGVWEGKALVTPEWVEASTTPAIPVANGMHYPA